jgi:hypothetical protein
MTGSRKLTSVSADYLPLHKYLDERFADVVVLKFIEIEDLLGHPLPPEARLQADWWATSGGDDAPSAQSLSWVRAHRSASANMQARTVLFERVSS